MREIDDHVLGPPGELTQAIQKRFFDAIKGKRDEYLEWLDFVEFDEGGAKKPPCGRAGSLLGGAMTWSRPDISEASGRITAAARP